MTSIPDSTIQGAPWVWRTPAPISLCHRDCLGENPLSKVQLVQEEFIGLLVPQWINPFPNSLL